MGVPAPSGVLSDADLEVNVLEFRQRSFSFDHAGEWDGEPYAVFDRTETESESQFRPRLVRLRLVVPRAWIVLDEANDELRLAQAGGAPPPRLIETVVEVGAEPPEFTEGGVVWQRTALPEGVRCYLPKERASALLSTPARTALRI